MNDIRLSKLGPAQKKLIVMALALTLFFVLAFGLMYVPREAKLYGLKMQLLQIQSEISRIETTMTEDKTLTSMIAAFEQRSKMIESKFPLKEEQGVRILSDFAADHHLEITSTKIQPKTVFLDENSQKVQIEGKTCQKLTVAMDMRGGYKDLMDYLNKIKESLPIYITVQQLRLSKVAPDSAILNIALDLNLYLLLP